MVSKRNKLFLIFIIIIIIVSYSFFYDLFSLKNRIIASILIDDINIYQYNYDYLKIFKKKSSKTNKINFQNSYNSKFIDYYRIRNCLYKNYLTVPIVFSSDDIYAPFLYITMVSILENANKNTFYAFYILVSLNFSKKYQNLINKLKYDYKCIIHFIFIKNFFVKTVRKISYITSTTYYRLLIGDILPEEFEKCIYLDIDICVCKDLSELFNINIGDNYIAGVVAPGYYFSEKYHCKRLNLPTMKQYINAGVLLMNLKQIRKDNMTQKFIKLSKNIYDYQDQDILNIACYGKILTLPPKYNALVGRLKENNPLLRNLYSEDDISEANNSPHIIHFPSIRKPWNSIGVYMEDYWWNIAKKTPFINSMFNRHEIYKKRIKKNPGLI